MSFSLTTRQWITLALIAAAGLAIAVAPLEGVKPGVMPAFAIVLVTVALFASSVLSTIWIAVVFFVLALPSGIVAPITLVSGFWSNAAMLIFGGLVMGAAAERSGLGRYVARGLMQRFVGSYFMLLLGVMIGTSALSFIVPSTVGRLAIVMPIVLAIAKEAGYLPGSNGYAGLVLTAVVGNFTTSFSILPANLVNVIILGAGEGLYGPQLRYADYLLLLAPVAGALKAITVIGMALLVFRAPAPSFPDATGPLPLSRAGRRLAAVLAITVLLWATDSWHGVKPGPVALMAALMCLLPPVALVGLKESFDLPRIAAVIGVPTILGMATLLTQSGAGGLIADAIKVWVPLNGHSAAYGFAAVAVLSSLVAIIGTIVGAIAIITPLIGEVATATGLSVKLGLVAEITGLQAVFFHYEAMPVIVGISMAQLPVASAVRFMIPLAVIGLFVILPAEILWLKLIGMLP